MPPKDAMLRILAQGFNPWERQMLSTVAKLSQRRQPQLTLLSQEEGQSADVVMLDGQDTQATKWAAATPWLHDKVVIWVDAPAMPGRTVVNRPVQWSILPMLLARAMEAVAVSSPQSASAGKPILIVDDSRAVRYQLRSLLESRGIQVNDADCAEAAIKTAAAVSYSCILMDVVMPGVDGYEACRHIKANTRSGDQPAVIMLTSNSSPFDRIKGKMAGCDAYLTKPVDKARFYEVVARYAESVLKPRSN